MDLNCLESSHREGQNCPAASPTKLLPTLLCELVICKAKFAEFLGKSWPFLLILIAEIGWRLVFGGLYLPGKVSGVASSLFCLYGQDILCALFALMFKRSACRGTKLWELSRAGWVAATCDNQERCHGTQANPKDGDQGTAQQVMQCVMFLGASFAW